MNCRLEALEDRRLLAATPTISINDVQQLEGDGGTSYLVFSVTRSGKTSQSTTVGFETVDGTAQDGGIGEDADYLPNSGTLTFAPREKTQTIAVGIVGDTTIESDQQFFVNLTVIDNGKFGDSQGVGTIVNDDAGPQLPSISIDDVQIVEGNVGTTELVFTMTRSGDTSGPSSVEYQTVDGSGAAGSDYAAIPTTAVTFAAGEATKEIVVDINGDTSPEEDETFSVTLANPSNATLSRATGTGTILDDDSIPTIAFSDFSDPSGLELVGSAAAPAGTGNVLRLTPAEGGQNGAAWYSAAKQFVTVDWETTFDFNLNDNQNSPGGSDGFVFAIQNHDPTFLQGGGGNLGYSNLPNSLVVEFDTYRNVNADDPSDSHISVHTNGIHPNGWDEALSLGSYTTPTIMDDAATHTARIRYTPGTLSVFLDDLTSPVLTVDVDLSQTLDLDVGRAWVGFTAATGGGWQNHDILNWDYRVLADTTTTIGINNVSLREGDAGSSDLVFTVTRLGDTSGRSSVKYQTDDGTAKAGIDYAAIPSTTLDFAAGETEKLVNVTMYGDAIEEAHETLFLRLSDESGALLVDNLGIGTILNDETSISISDGSAVEGVDTLRDMGRFVTDGSGGLSSPRGLVFGPDGNADGVDDLYVASVNTDEILRYDGVNGTFLDSFVKPRSGGLDNPGGLAFGTDGLYVSSRGTGSVLRFDGETGDFLGTVASDLAAPLGVTFDDAGKLYITDQGSNEVLRYDGANLNVFVSSESSGLNSPRNAEFGPDGNGDGVLDLYVASQGSDEILRYDGVDGSFIDVFATVTPPLSPYVNGPNWLEFGEDGYLYVSSRTTADCCDTSILRIDSATGDVLDAFPLGRDGWSFTVGPDNVIYNSGNGAGDYVNRVAPESVAALTISLSVPTGEVVTVDYSTFADSAAASDDYTAVTGTVLFEPGVTEQVILVPTVDDVDVEADESFTAELSNAANGLIVDSQGEVTIRDNDGPQIYVYNIAWEYRRGGKDWRAVFEIRADSNGSETGDSGDAPVAGVQITVSLAGQTITGTTDENGVFRTDWLRRFPGGTYYANVDALMADGHDWNPLWLDLETDTDGDGRPDTWLVLLG